MAWFNTNPVNSKNPKQKLYIYWYDKKKKRTSKKVTRFLNNPKGRALCKKFVKEFDNQIRQPDFYEELYLKIYPVKLSEAFQKFMDSRSIEESSKSVYRNAINRFIEASGDIPVNDYHKNDFIKFVNYLKEKKLAHNTISTYSKHLLVIWNWLKKNNYCSQIIITKIKQTHLPPVPIPASDLKIILQYFKKQKDYPHHYFAVKLLYLTGMRISSLVELQGRDIDFKNKVIYYNNKKAKRKSIFPVYKELESLLKKMDIQPNEFLVPLKDRSSFKFYYTAMKNLKLKYNLHQLRKTLATTLVENRLSIYDIQRTLDHSDVATTQKYYALATMERIRKEIDKNVKFVK